MKEKEAIAYGQLFDLSLGYPAMTVGESPIQGFVLTFTDSAILSILDELEDYQEHRQPEKNEYNRLTIATYDRAGKALGLAWAYLMTFEKVKQFKGVLMPSGLWNNSNRMDS